MPRYQYKDSHKTQQNSYNKSNQNKQNSVLQGWGSDSEIKSTYCFSRVLSSVPRPPVRLLTTVNSSSRIFLSGLPEHLHTHGIHTCTQIKIKLKLTEKEKYLKNKAKPVVVTLKCEWLGSYCDVTQPCDPCPPVSPTLWLPTP